jgi:hypothetical protein
VRDYVTEEDGSTRRVRGYSTAAIRSAMRTARNVEISSDANPQVDQP